MARNCWPSRAVWLPRQPSCCRLRAIAWRLSSVKQVQAPGVRILGLSNAEAFTTRQAQPASADESGYSIYGFHPGSAGSLFADGSVRYPTAETSADLVAAALTMAGRETVVSR